MKSILITGANGQLGSEIRVLSAQLKDFTFFFTDIDNLNITDAAAVDTFFSTHHPAFTVNCAAYTAVDKAEQDREAAFLLNAVSPGILAGACTKYHSRLIHISTDYVFDGTNHKPYREEDETCPLGVYGSTKREGEIRCMDLSSPVILRTSWLYSSFGSNFVKTILKLGREKDSLNVISDQVGTPTYARDLAEAILGIIHRADTQPEYWSPGIFHFSNQGACTWYDLAMAVCRLSGLHTKVNAIRSEEYPTFAKRPFYSVLDKSKIRSVYNIPLTYWMDSLEICIRVIKSQKPVV